MSLGSEFKEFAMKGNVIDLAVGVVIGAAFGKIVAALVADIIMPPIGLLVGGINFTDLAIKLGLDPTGKPVLLKYGDFGQTVLEFLIVAFVIFMMIKAINALKRPPPPAPVVAPPPTKEELLLTEIRDLLAKR
jgi:large conductance mechanosensitive channel